MLCFEILDQAHSLTLNSALINVSPSHLDMSTNLSSSDSHNLLDDFGDDSNNKYFFSCKFLNECFKNQTFSLTVVVKIQ